jgi:hypothetical protein
MYVTESEMVDHIKLKHAANMTELQIPLLLQACEQRNHTLDTSSCPFCPEWKADSNAETMKGYYRHISTHLQPLALASIPLVIDGLEIINEEETRRSEDLGFEERVAANIQDSSEMTNVMNFVMKPFREIQAKARMVISNLEKSNIGTRSIVALHQTNLALETEGRVALQTIEPLCVNLLHGLGPSFVDALTRNGMHSLKLTMSQKGLN